MNAITGFVAPGFEPVRDAFIANFDADLELGAGFAVWCGDELVINLQGGFADRARTRPWTDRTLVPVYSTTKPIAAMVVAMLADRGLLGFDWPVARLWPEFAAHGKQDFTIAEVLSHQCGLPGFPERIDQALWLDPPAAAAALALLPPMWRPGEGSGYHPTTYGYLVGEIVRRAAGRSLGTILRQEVCAPLDIDFWIGTPESEHPRCAEMLKPTEPTRFGARTEALRVAFLTPWASAPRNTTAWRTVEIPSANGHGTAAATARLYSAYAQKGRIGEIRLFSADTWTDLTRTRVKGPDRVLPDPMEFAAGVMRNNNLVFGPNPETLGHSGWGGSAAFGDPANGIAAAYVMSRQGPDLLRDPRRDRLFELLYACL